MVKPCAKLLHGSLGSPIQLSGPAALVDTTCVFAEGAFDEIHAGFATKTECLLLSLKPISCRNYTSKFQPLTKHEASDVELGS